MTRDRVLLQGLEFYGYHGVIPEENTLGQRFRVDLELTVDLREAGKSDDLTKTIDYVSVYGEVKRIVEGPAHKLIESVAEKVAESVLRDGRVREVRVRVMKPDVPVPAVLEFLGVEVVRSADGPVAGRR